MWNTPPFVDHFPRDSPCVFQNFLYVSTLVVFGSLPHTLRLSPWFNWARYLVLLPPWPLECWSEASRMGFSFLAGG